MLKKGWDKLQKISLLRGMLEHPLMRRFENQQLIDFNDD